MIGEDRVIGQRDESRVRTRGSLLVTLVFLWLVSCSAPAIGSEIETKSYPVPISIDSDECVASSLYIKCDVTEYNLPFNAFTSRALDTRERAFKELVLALRQKDLPACLELAFREGSLTEEELGQHNRHIEEMMNRYGKVFEPAVVGADFEKLQVSAQFYIGTGGLFVWGVDSPSSFSSEPFRATLRFDTSSENKFLWIPVSSRPSELTLLLTEWVECRSKSPEAFQPIENATFDYEFAIPGTNGGHAVYLQFDGRPYEFDVFRDQADPNDEILCFYQKAYHTLRDRSIEAFAEFFTVGSRDKYLEWLKKCDPSYLEWYHRDIIDGGRKVVFILNAKPFYFVFYRTSDGTIRFQDIVRDPKDNQLKFTNFYYNDYVHQLLGSRELFVKPMLKSIVKIDKDLPARISHW